MSLIKCPECGNEVSEFAEMCPKCGCPISIILDSKDNYCHKIKIDSEREYDLTNFDKTVDTETLQNVVSIARMLMHDYQIPGLVTELEEKEQNLPNLNVPCADQQIYLRYLHLVVLHQL